VFQLDGLFGKQSCLTGVLSTDYPLGLRYRRRIHAEFVEAQTQQDRDRPGLGNHFPTQPYPNACSMTLVDYLLDESENGGC